MRRQVLSRVRAAVGARSLRGARLIPGNRPKLLPSRGLASISQPETRRRTLALARALGQRGLGAHNTPLPARSAPGEPPGGDTLTGLAQDGCVLGAREAPGWPRPLRSEIRSRPVVKMFDVDPSYFQGMKVVPLSTRTQPRRLTRMLPGGPLPPAFLLREGDGAADGRGLMGSFSELAAG